SSPIGSAACEPMSASYLTVEYRDDAWASSEQNLLTVTIQPQTPGAFYIYVRSTMRKPGTACEYTNDLPGSGERGFIDQTGWAVRRFAVNVVDAPDPTFVGNVEISATAIEIGQTFTVTASVRNDGSSSDDGRVSFSFPVFAAA